MSQSSINPQLTKDEYDREVDGIVDCYKDVYGPDVLYDDVHGLLRGNHLVEENPDSVIAYSDGNRVTTKGQEINDDEDRRKIARDILADELAERFINAAEQRRS